MKTKGLIQELLKGLSVTDQKAFITQAYSEARVRELELIERIKAGQNTEKSVTAENELKVTKSIDGKEYKTHNVTLHVENGRIIKSARSIYDVELLVEVENVVTTARYLEELAKQLDMTLPEFKNVGKVNYPVFVKA